MRTDHALYTVAVILFIISGIILAGQMDETKSLGVVATTILGIFFAGLGYVLRPKTTAIITLQKPEEITKEKIKKGIPLTEVKGIGEKRAAQLKGFGINFAEELAEASPEELAAKLKVSSKIVQKWIADAKKLTQSQK